MKRYVYNKTSAFMLTSFIEKHWEQPNVYQLVKGLTNCGVLLSLKNEWATDTT